MDNTWLPVFCFISDMGSDLAQAVLNACSEALDDFGPGILSPRPPECWCSTSQACAAMLSSVPGSTRASACWACTLNIQPHPSFAPPVLDAHTGFIGGLGFVFVIISRQGLVVLPRLP